MKLKYLIIEDEPLAIDLVADFSSKIDFLEPAGAFTEPVDALKFLESESVDLIFLDIHMPELNGLQLMRMFNNKYGIIVITAYDKYAIEGFDNQVIDYLLKPLSFDRFYKACQRAKAVLEAAQGQQAFPAQGPPNDFIFVKSDKKIFRVNLADILYVTALKDYVVIYTVRDKIMTLQNLKTFQSYLPENLFFRVHKSFIISIAQIESIQQNNVLIAGKPIPIGESYHDEFYKAIESRHSRR